MNAPFTNPDDSPSAQACYWVVRLHSADCTEAERLGFMRWLAQDKNHRNTYHAAAALWLQMEGLRTTAEPQLQAARTYLLQARQKRSRPTLSWLAIAASLLLVLSAAPDWWAGLNTATYRTKIGERAHFALSDGSSIDLNTNSEVQVYYAWNARKATLLSGEAFFTVRHNSGKPFEVTAGSGRIRDLGTQFDVYRQENEVAVAVLEGEVAVNTSQGTASFVQAGQQINYDLAGQLSAIAPIGSETAAWREGRLTFAGQTLAEALKQLNRYHPVALTLRDPKLSTLRVSGSFPSDNLKLALDTLTAALPIKIISSSPQQILLGSSNK